MRNDDAKRALARASAAMVFDYLCLIDRYRAALSAELDEHDPGRGDSASRRDCGVFWGRLGELGLVERARREAKGK